MNELSLFTGAGGGVWASKRIMRQIIIEMKDGNSHKFEHQPRPGGSWRLSIRYEGAWVIVKDEGGKEQAFPASDVRTVKAEPRH